LLWNIFYCLAQRGRDVFALASRVLVTALACGNMMFFKWHYAADWLNIGSGRLADVARQP